MQVFPAAFEGIYIFYSVLPVHFHKGGGEEYPGLTNYHNRKPAKSFYNSHQDFPSIPQFDFLFLCL